MPCPDETLNIVSRPWVQLRQQVLERLSGGCLPTAHAYHPAQHEMLFDCCDWPSASSSRRGQLYCTTQSWQIVTCDQKQIKARMQIPDRAPTSSTAGTADLQRLYMCTKHGCCAHLRMVPCSMTRCAVCVLWCTRSIFCSSGADQSHTHSTADSRCAPVRGAMQLDDICGATL